MGVMAAACPERAEHVVIKLPRTAPRSQAITCIKLIRRIAPSLDAAPVFEGPILRPGANVDSEVLGARPVMLEYAGPAEPARRVGSGWGRGREHLYVLWRYDWGREEWIELGRVRAAGPEWVTALRPLAMAVLAPERPRLIDVSGKSERIAEKVVDVLDEQLQSAIGPVKGWSTTRRRRAAPTARRDERLISPKLLMQFREKHWGKRPLSAANGSK